MKSGSDPWQGIGPNTTYEQHVWCNCLTDSVQCVIHSNNNVYQLSLSSSMNTFCSTTTDITHYITKQKKLENLWYWGTVVAERGPKCSKCLKKTKNTYWKSLVLLYVLDAYFILFFFLLLFYFFFSKNFVSSVLFIETILISKSQSCDPIGSGRITNV